MQEQKNEAFLPACPVETTLMLIGDKWKVLILRDLMPGTKRFGELKKSIGSVSQKVLTAQLRAMEESGLIARKVYAEVPPRVEYSLTELGKSLKPILDACRSGEKNTKPRTRKRPGSRRTVLRQKVNESLDLLRYETLFLHFSRNAEWIMTRTLPALCTSAPMTGFKTPVIASTIAAKFSAMEKIRLSRIVFIIFLDSDTK